MIRLVFTLVALFLSALAMGKERSNAWHASAHEVGETHSSKSEVLQQLGKPEKQIAFAFSGSHNQGQHPLVQCSTPPVGTDVEALYYAIEGDAVGYWFFFHNEQMLCFSGRTSLGALREWYEP